MQYFQHDESTILLHVPVQPDEVEWLLRELNKRSDTTGLHFELFTGEAPYLREFHDAVRKVAFKVADRYPAVHFENMIHRIMNLFADTYMTCHAYVDYYKEPQDSCVFYGLRYDINGRRYMANLNTNEEVITGIRI